MPYACAPPPAWTLVSAERAFVVSTRGKRSTFRNVRLKRRFVLKAIDTYVYRVGLTASEMRAER